MQNTAFYNAKGGLSARNMPPFADRKAAFYDAYRYIIDYQRVTPAVHQSWKYTLLTRLLMLVSTS